MPNPRLASRYAKSLLDLAVERNQVEKIFADMQWLGQVIKSSRDFANLLRSPIIKPEKKQKVLQANVAGKGNENRGSFVSFLISKGKERQLPEVFFAFPQ